MKYEILLFYKYVQIADPEAVAAAQRQLCEQLGLTGRIIIAHEGINATVEGKQENTQKYVAELLTDSRFTGIHFKRSPGNGNAFPKLSVKVRPEIVSAHLGGADIDPNITTGKYIQAEELHELIHSGKEFYIVDMRNDYEHKVGHFAGSLMPSLRNFRDLPMVVEDLAHLKGKTIVTVCTGGVRCEKASGFLVQNGFADVYQLYGGIVTYMEKYPNEDFVGKLYVFDGRLTMGFNVDAASHNVVGKCELCGVTAEDYANCINQACHKHFICCADCRLKFGGACSADCQLIAEASKSVLGQLKEFVDEVLTLSALASLAGWDQEVMMPPAAAAGRAKQLTYLSGKIHSLITDPKFKQLASAAEPEIDELTSKRVQLIWQKEVEQIHELIDKSIKLPAAFVARKSDLVARATSIYAVAKPKNDWDSYKPVLKELVAVAREEGRLLGSGDPYENLIDNFDRGLKLSTLDKIFAGLAEELPKIIAKADKFKQLPDSFTGLKFSEAKQIALGKALINKIGLTEGNIRLDKSIHPFSTSVGFNDARITTRYNEQDLRESLFGVLHESGHSYYELGVSKDMADFFVGHPDSLTIHESQSRFWENMLGRSMDFWHSLYKPLIQGYFPAEMTEISLADFYLYINQVQPGLIRTSADELTYNLHVLIRYQLEKQLIAGDLEVEDLPQAWNASYEKYLAVNPPDFKSGVMQDIHWAHGTFGYFPTYTTGTILSAMLMQRYNEAHPEGKELIKLGKLKSVRTYLQKSIWSKGSLYSAAELVQLLFGKELDVNVYLDYLKAKYN
jgi:carboxypeptidase Taq